MFVTHSEHCRQQRTYVLTAEHHSECEWVCVQWVKAHVVHLNWNGGKSNNTRTTKTVQDGINDRKEFDGRTHNKVSNNVIKKFVSVRSLWPTKITNFCGTRNATSIYIQCYSYQLWLDINRSDLHLLPSVLYSVCPIWHYVINQSYNINFICQPVSPTPNINITNYTLNT